MACRSFHRCCDHRLASSNMPAHVLGWQYSTFSLTTHFFMCTTNPTAPPTTSRIWCTATNHTATATAGAATSFTVALSTCSLLYAMAGWAAWSRSCSNWTMYSASVSSVGLNTLSLRENSSRHFLFTVSSWWHKTSGSTTLVGGASPATSPLNCSTISSLAFMMSIFTKASRKPMAIPELLLKASAKFCTTWTKLVAVIAVPNGFEGCGKFLSKSSSQNMSSKLRKSGSMALISPWNLGLVTAFPGWSKPKQRMLLNVFPNRITLSLESIGTLSTLMNSCKCSSI
mmetsp:Transcript_60776/g.144776  ORF Transcript_60776/g.144776 Transcript_60776/m.144776 type:complete len:285 (+) Transcript_60776:294-1148(+)